MRIVIVTGKAPRHKNLCVTLVRTQEVVGVIHPAFASGGLGSSVRRLARHIKRDGMGLVLLHLMRGVPAPPWSRLSRNGYPPADMPAFREAVRDYDRLPGNLIHDFRDVKSPETHALLRSLRPDITVCLGGPVYPKAFIEASPLTLNFHSGISPLYNGTDSIHFAFANGHPHLCGGTLMVMGAGVDNGGILGHYLPAIQSGDTADTLFQKTVAGAAGMYERLLASLASERRELAPIPQPRALFYTRSIDYGWHNKIMAARHYRANLAGRFARPEKIVEYWRAPSPADACSEYRETLQALLWDQPEKVLHES